MNMGFEMRKNEEEYAEFKIQTRKELRILRIYRELPQTKKDKAWKALMRKININKTNNATNDNKNTTVKKVN